MAKVRGLDHFTSYFKGLEDHYVIIGGSAASVLMEGNALTFRATQDIDLVILADPSDDVAQRMLSYVRLGAYKVKESTLDEPKYYRYREPKSEEFPKMIEIFSRNSKGLELEDGQHIIPVDTGGADRLSAILLDDEYFDLIKENLVTIDGHRIINEVANICLKARAFCDLSDQKEQSKQVDQKDINKHRNDILKLSTTLNVAKPVTLKGRPRKDLDRAIVAMEFMDRNQVGEILKGYPIKDTEQLLKLLRKTYV